MSSGEGPVSAASGIAAPANVASRRQRGNSNYRIGLGGGNMRSNRRTASADFCLVTPIAEAA